MAQASVATPDQCAGAIMDTVPLAFRFIKAEMRRQGAHLISVPQFRALTYIHRHTGASLLELAEHLGVTSPTASAIVERLVRRGLLARSGHPQERRRIVLALTRTGARLLEQARATTRSHVARLLAGVPAGELGKIWEGLALLERAIKEDSEANGGLRGRR
jgi:DNA-binding MarR family transcriptional regulator